MPKSRKTWTFSPGKKPKAALSGSLKDEVDTKAGELIETVLKPKHVQPPPEDAKLNYITDIRTKWVGPKCYFISLYACPGPNAVSPSFEAKFAKMEFVGDGKFALSFMRHTEQWVLLYDRVTVDECMTTIKDDPWSYRERLVDLSRSTNKRWSFHMSVPDEVRRDAEKTGELVRKKLMEIMDLQADIDALLRDKHPTPFGSKNWQYADIEALQRLVAMTAIQFVLFEPVERVKGNEEVKVRAESLVSMLSEQLKTLKTKKSDW
jgi:hypothetical protein